MKKINVESIRSEKNRLNSILISFCVLVKNEGTF